MATSSLATFQVCADPDEVARRAVDRMIEIGRQSIAEHGRVDLALSGGSTPARMFQLLAAESGSIDIDWSRVHLFWGDERHVPPDHDDSNYRMTRDLWLSNVDFQAENVHRFETKNPDPHAVATHYEQALQRHFGDGTTTPVFDLVFLGLGGDAHTASLFPFSDALYEAQRSVVAHEVEGKGWRLTLTYRTLNAARHVAFLVTGSGKQDAMRAIHQAAYRPSKYPAQGIRPWSQSLTWIVDEDALPEALRPND